jgi:hypothetical protein
MVYLKLGFRVLGIAVAHGRTGRGGGGSNHTRTRVVSSVLHRAACKCEIDRESRFKVNNKLPRQFPLQQRVAPRAPVDCVLCGPLQATRGR